jgi:hypothetical protein
VHTSSEQEWIIISPYHLANHKGLLGLRIYSYLTAWPTRLSWTLAGIKTGNDNNEDFPKMIAISKEKKIK